MSGLTKFFYNTMKGAPKLTHEWGSLHAVVKFCLTGMGGNSNTIESITIEDGIAELHFNEEHGFMQHQVIMITGATPTTFNKEYRVVSSGRLTLKIKTDEIIEPTGVIIASIASLGWTEKFSGDMKSVFQPKDNITNPFFLRLDNSRPIGLPTTLLPSYARVSISNTMSTIDDFGDGEKAPTSFDDVNTNEVGSGPQGSVRVHGWAKWYQTIYTDYQQMSENITVPTRPDIVWSVIGNDANMYIIIDVYPTNISTNAKPILYCFTVFTPSSSPDVHNCLLVATEFKVPYGEKRTHSSYLEAYGSSWRLGYTLGHFILRPYTGLGPMHVNASFCSLGISSSSGYTNRIPLPSRQTNSIILHDIYVLDPDGLRGVLPTIQWVHQQWPYGDRGIIENNDNKYIFISANHYSGETGAFAYKIEG